jgi:hypothetical protein
MVGTIIYEVGTIICDIGTINVRFYLLEVRYPHGYCRITLNLLLVLNKTQQKIGIKISQMNKKFTKKS